MGRGSALFACGWCASPRGEVDHVELLLNGEATAVSAERMPRGDVVDALSPDPPPGSLLSGFWAVVPIPPREPGDELVLRVRVRLADGSEQSAELGRVRVEELDPPLELDPPEPGTEPFVCVCMATHEPSLRLFRRQVDSLKAQTHRNWVCLVSDDCSGPGRYDAIERELEGDPRFVL